MHIWVVAIILLLIQPLDSTLSKPDTKKKRSASSAAVPPCDTLVTERGLVTEKPVYKDILQNHMAYSLPHARTKQFPLTSLAYVSPENNQGYERARIFRHKFSHIAPALLYLSPAKSETGFAITGDQLIPQDWIRDMKSTGDLPIVPRLLFENWSSQDFNRLFTNQYVASGCCQTIVQHLRKRGLGGVTLDVWSMLMGHRKQDLVHFTQHLGRELRDNGLLFVLVVPPPLTNRQAPSTMFSRAEFDALFDSVDFFSIGPYDFAPQQPAAGGPGPVSPAGWLRACVESLVPAGAAAPQRRAKILLGLNFYGFDHVPGSPQLIDGPAYLAVLKRHRPELTWSAQHKEHFLTYDTGIGSHTLSYPTLASLKARLDLAKALGTGIAIWDLGQGLDYFFDLL